MKLHSLSVPPLILLCLIYTAHAQEDPGVVRLPDELWSAKYDALIREAQTQNASSPAWRAFRERYGEWYAIWNEYTHVPMRVWGEGYQVPGVARVTQDNVDGIARRFLRGVSDLLRTDVDRLRLVDANPYLGKWAVHYEQIHKGVPVLASDVIVRISDGGTVFMFGSEFQPELDVNVVPTIGVEQARILSATGLILPPGGAAGITDGSLAVLPVKSLHGITHHLAYAFTVPQDEWHRWRSWVDAHTGNVLWRYNEILEGIGGQVTSNVKPSSYAGQYQVMPNGWQYVTVNSANVITDASGNYTSTNSGTVQMKLQGPYCRISRQDGPDASVTQSIANNSTYNFYWSDANSVPAERTAFWSVNRSRDYIVTMDPAITGLNYQVIAKVNLSSTCNANFDGTNLNFYRSGTTTQGTCPNAAEMPDVVMHEYGHLVNAKVYIQYGKSSGMTNGALNEGVADANAALILDRAEMGVGFFGPNTVLRNLDNTNRYPQSIVGEVHTDGLIIGGAIWDMRVNIGVTLAGRLVQFARHAKPDDTNTGKAFTKFFLEILVADDNDANLANGTPNSSQIVPAFAKHGIPSGMLSIAHSKLTDKTANTSVPVTCSVTSQLSSITTQSVKLYFRPKGSSWSSVSMTMSSGTPGGTSNWASSIPSQPAGTIVEYYLEATEGWGSSITAPTSGASAPYRFLVGYLSNTLYEFESAAGWQGHIPGDGAMTGKWINADPVGTSINASTPVQPEDDHSASGTKCWVTGNGTVNSTNVGEADVDDGQTTLLSPALNLANLGAPVIRYWRWFSNDLGAAPGGDPWVVQISSDDGVTWTDVENSTTSFNRWEENLILVSDYVVPSATMRMRFIARDDDPQSLVEAAVDDVEILYTTSVPVELSTLSANRSGGRIDVHWTTESESGNMGFHVEFRPEDGDWRDVGFVAGHGTRSAPVSYGFSFEELSGRNGAVRLRQVDFDGSFAYSPIVAVSAAASDFRLSRVYPNPASDIVTILLDTPSAERVTISLTNLLGMQVFTRPYDLSAPGRHSISLRVGTVPPGVYACRISDGRRTTTGSILIAR